MHHLSRNRVRTKVGVHDFIFHYVPDGLIHFGILVKRRRMLFDFNLIFARALIIQYSPMSLKLNPYELDDYKNYQRRACLCRHACQQQVKQCPSAPLRRLYWMNTNTVYWLVIVQWWPNGSKKLFHSNHFRHMSLFCHMIIDKSIEGSYSR